MKIVLNTSNLFAWITGNARDTLAMKQRMRDGYDGKYSDDISKYDQFGLQHYTKIARILLEHDEIKGKEILDVGCGTGILSLLALRNGAASVTCSDASEYMLSRFREKLNEQGFQANRFDLRIADAEEMPFKDNSFDMVFSSMVLGLVPNQSKTIAEIYRLVKPGGLAALATHGTDHYYEASEATVRKVPKRYVFGYRMEYFPISESSLKKAMIRKGFTGVETRRITWKEDFGTGSELYDFFVSTSSGWWYSEFPEDKISSVADKIRKYMDTKNITYLTQDVVFAFGYKPT